MHIYIYIYHTLLCGRDGYCECVFWWQKGVKRVVFIALRLRQTEAERSEWWQWISISATHSERDKRDVDIGHFVWPFNKFRASPNQSPFPIYAHFCFLFFVFFSPGFLHWILRYSKSLVACGLELTQLIKYLIIE